MANATYLCGGGCLLCMGRIPDQREDEYCSDEHAQIDQQIEQDHAAERAEDLKAGTDG